MEKKTRYQVSDPRIFRSLKILREIPEEKIAGLMNKSRSLVSRIQEGTRTVSEENAQLISYLLGVQREFLFEPIERKKSK